MREGDLIQSNTHDKQAFVIEGDEGGITYLVAPAEYVRATNDALWQLVESLDLMLWARPDPATFYYHPWPVTAIFEGEDVVLGPLEEPWVHPQFVSLGVADAVKDVLRGRRRTID